MKLVIQRSAGMSCVEIDANPYTGTICKATGQPMVEIEMKCRVKTEEGDKVTERATVLLTRAEARTLATALVEITKG